MCCSDVLVLCLDDMCMGSVTTGEDSEMRGGETRKTSSLKAAASSVFSCLR